ncbi:MAG: hypothetical protein AAF219_04930 [Myxococcota bacterium]
MKQLGLWSPAPESLPAVVEPKVQVSAEQRADELARFLAGVMRRPVHLTITDNRRTMLSSREERGVLRLRLHHMFLPASPEIWHALGSYLHEGDARAGIEIDGFIERNQNRVRQEIGPLKPQGRFHDLDALFAELNRTYFHEASAARVTWGRAGSRRYRRSIQLGCYIAEDDLIRIHPCLDQSFVPAFYVSWVMFHEMLHEAFGVEERNGRRDIHPPAFVALEESYPDFQRAKAWERENLPRLLRYRPVR